MKQLTVTQKQVDENMKDYSVHTVMEFDKPICVVTLRMSNGFTIVETSSCVDPSKYDEKIGAQICLKKLENEVWYLLGFLLQERNSDCDSLALPE